MHAQTEPPVIEMFAANCEVQTVWAEIPIIEIFDTSPDAASHFIRLQLNDAPAFYREACAKAYPCLPERCEEDYHQLDAAYQTLLRNVILRSVQADEGVSLTAAILSACMAQAGFLVERLSYDGIADVVLYKTLRPGIQIIL